MLKKLSPLFILLFSLNTFADTLSLHLFRSPKGINWKNPWHMTISTLKNSLVKLDKRVFSISHVFVEVKCDSTGEHIFRGMTSSADSNERDLIFKQKYAMGVMFHNYSGVLEKNETVIKDIASYETSFRRAKASFKISPKTCQRMLQYAREYEARGYGSMYSGLQADPLKGEGAGCSAFGVSFLRVGGILEPFSKEWQEIINVPKRFVGGPLTGKRVPITRILLRPYAPWSDKEPHIHLEAWNPEKIHKWVKKIHAEVESGRYLGPYQIGIGQVGDAKEIEIDLSDRPTPTGNIWLIY